MSVLAERERVRFFLWSPVALGTGIAGYFALPSEPPLWLAVLPVIAVLLVERVLWC
jgi:competence protein ComEC